MWHSDDGGKTFATAPSFPGGFAEAQMAENSNGDVIIMFRVSYEDGVQATKGRGIAHSLDGGATFTNITLDPALKSVQCQCSTLFSKESQRVYYSSPSDLKTRSQGLVRSSTTGLDWSNLTGFALTQGTVGFGYSSLTELAETRGYLGVLWEKQVVGTHQPTDLVFSHVPLGL